MPGHDNIVNEQIKSAFHLMKHVYFKLCNIVFNTGTIPESWTIGIIKPIYKNKGSATLPENYRPITLLSCLGKLFNAVINTRVTNYIESSITQNNCKAGFRKGYSTSDNTFILQTIILFICNSRKKLFCTFIDLKQVFDTDTQI